STLIRALLVGVFGMSTLAEPEFGALPASTVGNVRPPSVESEILTDAVATGAAFVPATLQVTACTVLPASVVAVLGNVTAKGPAAAVTVTCETAVATAPPPAWLSRAVTRNAIARLVDGSTSPVRHGPAQPPGNVCGGTLALLRM